MKLLFLTILFVILLIAVIRCKSKSSEAISCPYCLQEGKTSCGKCKCRKPGHIVFLYGPGSTVMCDKCWKEYDTRFRATGKNYV